MTTKTQEIAFLLHILFLVGIYGAKVITAVLLDIFFISCLLCNLFSCFFLNATDSNNKKSIDFVDYSASSLWRCYNETNRGLHTATLVATSSSSCIINCAEAEDR